MAKQSAGILLYRVRNDEAALDAALREFNEETGYTPKGDFKALQPVVQKGGKVVHCWAVLGDLEPSAITSNTFPLEWPIKSGKVVHFPEIDKAGWFSLKNASALINERQQTFLNELAALLPALFNYYL